MGRMVRTAIAMALAAAAMPAAAEKFAFSYAEGDKYRVLSTVAEDVYVDRVLSHRAEILNRIAVEVREASGGAGTLEATFQTSERAVPRPGAAVAASFAWAREYASVFRRDAAGRMDIGGEYWMPVVRNVPILPDADLEPGAAWSSEGEEVHDFRDSFGIAEPYRIPFVASYRFLGERERAGRKLPAFSVSYRIFDEPPRPTGAARTWPARIMGSSDQVVYWDRELSMPAAYEETFRMVFELSDGRTVEYRGTAKAEVVEALPMDRAKVAAEIARDIAGLGIADATAAVSEAGVDISLEDVRFEPDSAVLLPEEKTKLDRVAAILRRYADRDLLVAGHTALAGTEAGRKKLSEERARAVADYLVSAGARPPERVVTRGYGATMPVADNATEEGKKKNRRVVITILEN